MSRDVGESGRGSAEVTDPSPADSRRATLADAVADGLFQVDGDGRFVAVNDAFVAVTGRSREELRGEPLEQAFPTADADRVSAARRGLVGSDPDTTTLSASLSTADGEQPCEIRLRLLDDAEGGAAGSVRPTDPDRADRARTEGYGDALDRTEARLHEESEKFRSLVEAVEEYAIFTLDPDGHVTSWNQGAARIKGYDVDEILGEHLSIFYTDEDRAAGVPEANLAAAEDGTVEDEGWRVREDGTRFWANMVLTPIRDDEGELTGYAKVTRDMTDRREREEALRRERDLVERILEANPVGIAVLDDSGEIVRLNEAGADVLGIDAGEVDDLDPGDWRIHDEDGDLVPPAEWPQSRALRTGEPVFDWRCELERADGCRRWLSANAVPLLDDAGEVERVILTANDVSALKRREADLRRERDLVEQILETSPAGIILVDDENAILRANERAAEVVGRPVEELTEMDSVGIELFDEDGARIPPDRHPSKRALETDETVVGGEYRIERGDGEWRWLSLNATPIHEDGRVERVVIVGDDVTQLKEQARMLARERDELAAELEDVLGRVSDAFFALDEEFRFTYVNDRAEQLIDCEEEEAVLGESIWEEYPETVDTAFQTEYERAMEAQKPVSFEEYYPPLSTWFEVNAYPSETGLSVYFRDVTERKEREQELETYETIVKTIEDGVYVLDEEFRFEMVNDAYVEMTGYDRDQLLGEHASVVVDEDVSAESAEQLQEIAAGEAGSSIVEADINRADGSHVRAESKFTAIPSDGAEEPRKVGVVRDVTDRKERERALEESRNRYQALVENFPNGAVALVDENLCYTTVGGTPIRESDATAAQLEGGPLDEMLPPEMADVLVPRYVDALDGERSEFDAEIGDRVYQFSILPVRNDAGDVFAALGMSQDVTERVERERELEEYETIVETVGDGIFTVDPDGTFTHVNGAYASMLGYEPEELIGRPASSVAAAEAFGEGEKLHQRLLDGETDTVGHEIELETADGETVPVEVRFKLLPSDDGEEPGTVGVVRDVTERKERERALEESERRYRTLAENFPDGAVGMYDHDLRYTLTEGTVLGETLPAAERLEGDRMPEIFPEDTVADLEPLFRAAVEDGETDTTTTEFGNRHWRVWAAPLYDADGEIFAGLSFAQDVTEQKEREQYLEDAKAQLEAAAEAGTVGTWEWHVREDRFVAGASMAKQFGVDPDAAREGVPLERFTSSIHEADRERVAADIEAALESCGEYESEYRVRNADGETRWVVARGRVECDEDGEAVTFPGALTDITERKRAELQLQRNNEQLESLFEILPVGVVVADADGRLVEANDTAREIWGGDVFDAESVAEYEQYSAVWADTGEPVEPDEWTMARVLDGEEVTDSDVFEIETADGGRRIVRVEGMPVRDASGEVTRGVVTLTDVTERKGRERELERYETIVETVNDGIYVVDEGGQFTMVNEEYASMAGYEPGELVGEHVTAVVEEEVVRQTQQLEAGLLAGDRESASVEAELEREDGEPVVAEATFALLSSDDGYERIGVVRDVTERKERERALEESERRYRTLAENFPDGAVALFDEDLRYTAAGGQFFDQVDTSPDDPIGDRIVDRHPPDLLEEVEPYFRATLEGEANSFEVELRGWHLHAHTLPVRNDDGEVFAGMLVVQDVTELREHERQLQTRVSQQEAVTDLGQQALEERDLDALFEEVTDCVAEVLDADYCKVLELLPDGEEVLLRSGVGWRDGLVGEATVGTGLDSQAGYTLRTDEPVVVDDLATETRFSGPDLLVDHDVTSGISTIIGTPGDSWGVLGVHTTDSRDFSEHDVNFVQSVATILATAIQRTERERDLELYETIVENIWDGVYALDPEDNFELVNEAFASMLGYDRDQLLGEPASVVHSEEISATADSMTAEVLESDGEAATMELELRAADGDVVPAETRFGPYPYDEERHGRTGVSRDITERLERERALERQREELAALNRLNQVVGEITHAAVESSSREEIERLVCDRLADSESYQFAWIGELERPSNTISLRTEAGVEGYLDDVTLAVDPADGIVGPTGLAAGTGEPQITQDIETDADYEPWRDHALEYGFRSSAAIPITYEDVLYGVLNVYSERKGAFGTYERSLLTRLGNVVGHAINALDRKEALMSDQIKEVEFEIGDIASMTDGSVATDGTISFDRTVAAGDGAYLIYGTADEDAMELLEELVSALPFWERVEVLEDRFGEVSFELRLSEPPAISTTAAYGGRVASAAIEDGDYRMTVELPPAADVRAVVEALKAEYPNLELVAQRRTTRDARSLERIDVILGDRLTERQRATLEAAYYAGYFDTPRKRSGEEVAGSLGISAPTLHQHLRKGQRKLLATVFDAAEKESEA